MRFKSTSANQIREAKRIESFVFRMQCPLGVKGHNNVTARRTTYLDDECGDCGPRCRSVELVERAHLFSREAELEKVGV